ncbi:hypothetical protein [Hydrogenimonas sp. SS33]|uniref:hypothetical protein n=1 Tax=Hydrogenimonas leucolamina TaxID=2954236 RepID=UPI00336C2E25
MLHYRRRNSTEPAPARRMNRHPLLTYLNWSYDRSRHLNAQQLREILTQYDERYAHLYMRLFNEVPRDVVSSYLRQERIDSSVLADIYRAMSRLGIDLRPFE